MEAGALTLSGLFFCSNNKDNDDTNDDDTNDFDDDDELTQEGSSF